MSAQRVKRGHLPAAPFRQWLRHQLADHGFVVTALATSLGRDEAVVRRWLDAAHPTVRLSAADECFIRVGDPGALSVLYPTEDR